MQNEFCGLLTTLRKQAGKSMGDIARHLGVSVPYVADVERGDRPPFTMPRLMAIADCLSLGPDDTQELIATAAKCRGSFELSAAPSQAHVDLGAWLVAHWDALTERCATDLLQAARAKTKEGSFRRSPRQFRGEQLAT